MLGLAESGREDLLKCMADNFAWMIENYGHIPNGNRTYYLSRSQPPVFALMVELFEEDGVRGARRYLDHLKMEYAFWMDGAESLALNQAYRHVVRMPDGSLLNRYWDDRDTPRDESWLEDVETAKHSGRPPNEVYRDLRAGAASGWDYSSRWLRDAGRLASIRTTQFIPIDLNAFLYKLESAIANISALKGERDTEALFRQKASDRRAAVNHYLWDDENGCYRDYDWRREEMALFSAASIVPLYVGMANHEQADRLANVVRSRLLTPGGIMATEYETGEQWDKPNGWAPLQWMAIQGFKRYGDDMLGDEIAHNWLKTVNHFYQEHHKLIEKYHISGGTPREGGGGEYPLQDGFGWIQWRGAPPDWPLRRALTCSGLSESHHKWLTEFSAIFYCLRWAGPERAAGPAPYRTAGASQQPERCKTFANRFYASRSAARRSTCHDLTL